MTDNQDFSTPTAGQADWDTDLNTNWNLADRGFYSKLTAAETINSGDVCYVGSGGLAWLWNATSLDLKHQGVMSYKTVNSGETDVFLFMGTVNSIGTWSGHIVPGEPVFVSPATTGFLVSSFSAAWPPVGRALRDDSVFFHPGHFNDFPEKVTRVSSFIDLAVNSAHFFSIDIGHRGIVRRIDFTSESHDQWTLSFWSSSTQVNSYLLFETQSGGVTSLFMRDSAPWHYENTDTASPGVITGAITVHSSTTGVGSGDFHFEIIAERFR